MRESPLQICYQSQVQTFHRQDFLTADVRGRQSLLQKAFKALQGKSILGLKSGPGGEGPQDSTDMSASVSVIDLQTPVPAAWTNAEVIVWGDGEGLDILRHSMAHILAHAVKRLYGKKVQVTIGPVIENGFYYDFKVDTPFTPDELPKIEKEMKKIIKERHAVVRKEISRQKAISFFKAQGEDFKVQIIDDLPPDAVISLYEQGDFTDLCRGPHVGTTDLPDVGFGLTGVSAAYWRGDAHNASLSRIYGTAFYTSEAYQEYLHLKEEAKRRDHRMLGAALDLFSMYPESPGQVLWHPKGVQLRNTLQALIRAKLKALDYIEIETPQVWSDVLWKRSGHYDHYKENMFFCDFERGDESETRGIRYGIKPMNCPGAALFFSSKRRSYRELPLRISEFGRVFRYEPSGVLHGLLRVRGFVQDDAHIFCRLSQVKQEVHALIELVKSLYAIFEFSPPQFVLSTRPKDARGDPQIWSQAEQALTEVLMTTGVEYRVTPGEGAFYGPKIDFNFRDALQRVWQLGTIQLDFFLAQRFHCEVINEHSASESVVVIHRAVLGSLERFIGICIEHYGGKFPVWLAPVQVKLTPISESFESYFEHKIIPVLEQHGIRFERDFRNEKISYKIRENQSTKVPYLLIAGQKEVSSGTISVRDLQGNEQQGVDLLQFLKENKWSIPQVLGP